MDCKITVDYKSIPHRNVDRSVLIRPVVEAGESLGFLPGDLQDKVGAYLEPRDPLIYSGK